MFDISNSWISFTCTNCGYEVEIQLIDAKSERTVYCHNCKSVIQLKDSEASVHSSMESINNSIKELEKLIKNFGK